MIWVIALIALIAIGGFAWWWYNGQNDTNMQGDEAAMEEKQYPDVVARINGEEVSKEDFKESLSQMQQVASQQGADLSNPTIQSQIETEAMNAIVSTRLLVQAAADAGVTVSDKDVDAEVSSLEAQFGGSDGLQEQMSNVGVTEDELRTSIREQLTVDAYLEQQPELADLTVSDEEISSFYDTLASQGQDVPELDDDLSSQIEQQLLFQKQQEATNAVINRLRANADVEVLI